MKFEYKLSRVRGMSVALRSLAQTPLVARLSYAISQTMEEFVGPAKLSDEAIKKLIAKYDGKETPGGLDIPDKHLAAFNIEFRELMDELVTVDVRPIELPPECEVPAAVLNDLQDFVFVKGMADAPMASGTDLESFNKHKAKMDAMKEKRAKRDAENKGEDAPVEEAPKLVVVE